MSGLLKLAKLVLAMVVVIVVLEAAAVASPLGRELCKPWSSAGSFHRLHRSSMMTDIGWFAIALSNVSSSTSSNQLASVTIDASGEDFRCYSKVCTALSFMILLDVNMALKMTFFCCSEVCTALFQYSFVLLWFRASSQGAVEQSWIIKWSS